MWGKECPEYYAYVSVRVVGANMFLAGVHFPEYLSAPPKKMAREEKRKN